MSGPAQAGQHDGTIDNLVVRAQLVEDIGASERVNYSGKLRMLSQRIAAASCIMTAGIEPELSRDVLAAAAAEFEKIANGLRNGDADLNMIGAEERRKTLVALDTLDAEWAPIRAAVDEMLGGGDVAEQNAIVAERNLPLLKAAVKLVSEISGEYSNPAEMMQSDAMVIDISGRQRMLTQKMSKEACQIWSGTGSAETPDMLRKTMGLFDTSLNALDQGMPAAGIIPPPTEEIAAGLTALLEDWAGIKAVLEEVAAGAQLDGAGKAALFGDLNTALRDMNAVVGLYTSFAKHEQ
ncbi:type IV pili methyl-accepting chemotaxis transducer N-terminal domain-containing protein [Aestuariibius sp. 2305UL40-4]|uniref:type IV pili methyl-accepting chemotaxis transducer N-terminal domain-containing protein n=1 Tax=Aestuariibius violaceus TaxID=3234132 RepID=UPI00348B6FB4